MGETFHKSSGNVFKDIGFTPAEAAELTAKSKLITAIVETIDKRKLTQKEAAHRCRTDQPTLSKVLRGRMQSVTIDRLTAWLTALGRTVEIHVRPYDAKAETGHLVTAPQRNLERYRRRAGRASDLHSSTPQSPRRGS